MHRSRPGLHRVHRDGKARDVIAARRQCHYQAWTKNRRSTDRCVRACVGCSAIIIICTDRDPVTGRVHRDEVPDGHLLPRRQCHYQAWTKNRRSTDRRVHDPRLMRYHRLDIAPIATRSPAEFMETETPERSFLPRRQYRFQVETKNRRSTRRCVRDLRSMQSRHFDMLRSRLGHR